MSTQTLSKTLRLNKSIWRIAEWLYDNICSIKYYETRGRSPYLSWKSEPIYNKNELYDKALELLRKMNNYEFTGEDYEDQ